MSDSDPPEILKFRHYIHFIINLNYTLYHDRIVVTGSRTWVPRLESTIWLNTLSANPSTLWLRSAHFQWAMILLICISLVSALILPGAGPATLPILVFDAIVALPVLAYLWWSKRLIRYAQFSTPLGATILSVGDTGPDYANFEAFVAELLNRIRVAHTHPVV